MDMVEIVVALLMIVNGEIKEHRLIVNINFISFYFYHIYI